MKRSIYALSLAAAGLCLCALTACQAGSPIAEEYSVEATEQQAPAMDSRATFGSADKWASWSGSGYTVYNNVWGGNPGYQYLWVNNYDNWGVWTNHPATSGIKSYPNVTKYIGKKLSALTWCTSTFTASTPSGGSWSSTFDIWDSGKAHEIMLWYNWTGAVSPISYTYNASGSPVPVYSNVTVGGSTWNIYVGSNGSNKVYSFLRTTKTNNPGSIDIRGICAYLKGKGYFGDITLGDVQYGFEITSAAAGLNFACNGFWAGSN